LKFSFSGKCRNYQKYKKYRDIFYIFDFDIFENIMVFSNPELMCYGARLFTARTDRHASVNTPTRR